MTSGISKSFCSSRIDHFISIFEDFEMAPDCSFDEDFIPYLTGHNVFNSPGIKQRLKSSCVRNKTATLFTIDT